MTTPDEVEAIRQPAKTILLQSVNPSTTTCRACHARVRWARTQRGKNMLIAASAKTKQLTTGGIEISTDDVHWATCPHAKHFRREERTAPSERID